MPIGSEEKSRERVGEGHHRVVEKLRAQRSRLAAGGDRISSSTEDWKKKEFRYHRLPQHRERKLRLDVPGILNSPC